MTIKAVYRNGRFVPTEPVDLDEGSEVELTVGKAGAIQPEVTDPEERQRILEEMLDEWRKNPWPINRKWTRDELHERR